MVTAFPPSVLFVDHATGLGGAEHSLLLLLSHLDVAEWQPHLACPAGVLAEQAQQHDIPWHPVTLPRLRRSVYFPKDWLYDAGQLVQVAKQIDAAAFYANTVRGAIYAALAARIGKRPFIWHMRDFWLSENEPRYHQLDWAIKTILCRAAAHIITNSAATARHLPCAKKITIVHNGIDLARFRTAQNTANFRNRFNIPFDAPLVGMVGRLRPWKGQERFIEMATAVAAIQPETHFVIVGGSPFAIEDAYPEKLRQLAQEKNLAHCLHFTGHLTDVRPALAALDIFVHPGEPEPFGLVNIEAMAAGKPIAAFAHGALPEIVFHEETGLLVPPGDGAALAQAVITLLHSPEKRKKYGQAGKQRAQNHFTIQQTAVQVAAVLQNVLEEK